MARKNLFNTEFAMVTGLKDSCSKVVKYLIDNRNCYLASSTMRNIYQISPMMPSPFNLIFDHLKNSDKLDKMFAPIHLTTGMIPEILTTGDIVIDLAQIENSQALKSYTEFYNKVLVNLSPIIKISKTSQTYNVSDINVLHSLYTKASLVASYQDSDGWLNPTLSTFIVKTYSMVISGLLAKQYNLNLFEQMNVAAPLAIFMCQLLANKTDDYANPMLFNRCTFLTGNSSSLSTLAKSMSHMTASGLTIGKLCELIKEMGPPRMETFNPQILYRNISSLGTSSIQMTLALEYPPYWVYQLLTAVGNFKTKLLYELKNNKLFDECKQFVVELNKSSNFINELNR